MKICFLLFNEICVYQNNIILSVKISFGTHIYGLAQIEFSKKQKDKEKKTHRTKSICQLKSQNTEMIAAFLSDFFSCFFFSFCNLVDTFEYKNSHMYAHCALRNHLTVSIHLSKIKKKKKRKNQEKIVFKKIKSFLIKRNLWFPNSIYVICDGGFHMHIIIQNSIKHL